MIHHPAKPKPAKRGGEGSLCVSPVIEDRAQHGLGCLPEVAIKLDSMWLPMLQGTRPHKMSRPNDPIRSPQKKQGGLRVIETLKALGKRRSFTNEPENDGDPSGTPRMQISSVGTRGTPSSLRGQSAVVLAFNHDHSHLFGLSLSPSGGPFSFSNFQTWRRTGAGATIPPSSMYHFWYSGLKARISSTKGARARQK